MKSVFFRTSWTPHANIIWIFFLSISVLNPTPPHPCSNPRRKFRSSSRINLLDLHICFPIFNSWVFVVIIVDLFVVIDIYSGNYHHISEEQLHKLRCSIKSTIINAQFNKSDSQLKSTVIITSFLCLQYVQHSSKQLIKAFYL